MYKNIKPFGHHIYGETLGEAWLELVKIEEEKDVILDGKTNTKKIQKTLGTN